MFHLRFIFITRRKIFNALQPCKHSRIRADTSLYTSDDSWFTIKTYISFQEASGSVRTRMTQLFYKYAAGPYCVCNIVQPFRIEQVLWQKSFIDVPNPCRTLKVENKWGLLHEEPITIDIEKPSIAAHKVLSYSCSYNSTILSNLSL